MSYASQESVAATLTEAERLRDGTNDRLARALGVGWRAPTDLNHPGREVYLLLPGEIVVKDWLATSFRTAPRTFWTWDGRFARKLESGRVVPGLVDPMAWCEIEEAATA